MRQTRRENTAVERIVSQVWTPNHWVLGQTLIKLEDWTTTGSYREALVFNQVSSSLEKPAYWRSRELERVVVKDVHWATKNKGGE